MRKPFPAGQIWFVGSLSAVILLALSSQSGVYADASNEKGGYTVATGPLDTDLEAYFFLDALTGELKVAAINPRTGKFMAVFQRKILDDFKNTTPKIENPSFMMVTGLAKIVQGAVGGGGQWRFAESVIYVTELTSGTVVCYGIKVPANLRNQNGLYVGEIVGLDKLDLRKPAAAAAR
jgi:hypothetical protein